jgi:hypothetical protein
MGVILLQNVTDATRDSLLSRLKHWDDDASWQDFFQTSWRLLSLASSGLGELTTRYGGV